jgi:excisionase family DNA binding protein
VDQRAENLGVTRDPIYRWIDRKSLPAHRVGGYGSLRYWVEENLK